MKDQDLYIGFSKEKQADYEKQLMEYGGKQAKIHIEESKRKTKGWSKTDWDQSRQEFEEICHGLARMMKNRRSTNSSEVQNVIHRHYQWLKKFWIPNKETYIGHAEFIRQSELRKAYEVFHPKLPEFIAEAIQEYAKYELT